MIVAYAGMRRTDSRSYDEPSSRFRGGVLKVWSYCPSPT
jgi:hypothetical protein